MERFLWFSPKAPPQGHREVPEGGFCVSAFLVVRDERGRVLAGRYAPDHPELELRTGMDAARRHKYARGFTLPARHLRLGESPEETARSIARDLAPVDIDALRLVRAWAESYDLDTYPGRTHHDLMFGFAAQARGEPRVPPWYAELRFVREDEVAWARGHDDVLAAMRE